MKYYPVCIYTIKNMELLKKAYAFKDSTAFNEKTVWRTGHRELLKARKECRDMLILFGAAEEERGIIYAGVLENIEIDEISSSTKYKFSMRYEFSNPKPLSKLILLSSDKPMSDDYIRPYAVVKLPEELDDWITEEGITALSHAKKTGQELFTFNGQNIGTTVTDFWRWAFSDLCENTLRGVLAEYIVASALGIGQEMQENWKSYDLDYKGIKIEVKSSAYLQSWWQKSPSAVGFGISETLGYNSKTNKLDDVSKRQSDIYVFCLLKHRIKETLDSLRLEQWRFYIVETRRLNQLCKGKKRISLKQIKDIKHTACDYDRLKGKIDDILNSIKK